MNNINEIESLTWDQAQKMATEIISIKGHDIVLTDLGGRFGYSALVFRNKGYMYFANEYQLHYKWFVDEHGIEALKGKYIEKLDEKLFSEEEFAEKIKRYTEYRLKDHYLRNYWIQQFPHETIFCIGGKEIDTVKYPHYCSVCFCYVSDRAVAYRAYELLGQLNKAYDVFINDLDAFREAISNELANHEACITGDFREALNALGMQWSELSASQKNIVLEELHKQEENYG